MKHIFWVHILVLLGVIVGAATLFPTGAAQARVFSPVPAARLRADEATMGRNVQKFNGVFIRRLANAFASQASEDCLRSLGDAKMALGTFASGAVVAQSPRSCEDASKAPEAEGGQTGSVEISSNRLLAIVLVVKQFRSKQTFADNLSRTDVDVFDRSGIMHLLFVPPPGAIDARVASTTVGCPQYVRPYLTSYLVDLRTYVITLGHSVC